MRRLLPATLLSAALVVGETWTADGECGREQRGRQKTAHDALLAPVSAQLIRFVTHSASYTESMGSVDT